MSEKKRRMSAAMTFIVLFGVVSLFSDMTHESANSIRGAFLSLAGASAAVIGFVSGLGELVGYGLRYVFGRLTDRTRRYWPMVLFGYALDVVAVPALALVGRHGWALACALLIGQRLGKAIKKPAKDTVMSFAASQEGVGKSFAIQELLDQIGAVLGPLLLYLIMLIQHRDDTFSDYRTCFAFLAIPGAITLLLLWLTYKRFPHPENFEPEPKEYVPFRVSKRFVVYIVGISLFAFGFADYSLIVMHFSRQHLFTAAVLPLLYALAMLTDAASAFVFGWLFDRHARLSLVVSTLVAAPFAVFAFLGGDVTSMRLALSSAWCCGALAWVRRSPSSRLPWLQWCLSAAVPRVTASLSAVSVLPGSWAVGSSVYSTIRVSWSWSLSASPLSSLPQSCFGGRCQRRNNL